MSEQTPSAVDVQERAVDEGRGADATNATASAIS
jgi:hypothetical protein